MFSNACTRNRHAIYGVMGLSQVDKTQVNSTNGTAFMIAPGVLATAAHFVHRNNDPTQPAHQRFEVIRAPDVGQNMEVAELVAEDTDRNVALLKIRSPRSKDCLALEDRVVSIGTSCGSLGFPLAEVIFTETGRTFNLVERFQGATISAFYQVQWPSGRSFPVYETDALMYSGSSGCPGFLVDGGVLGMHVRSRIDRPKATSGKGNDAPESTRLAISLWVPSSDICTFAREHDIAV